MMKWLNFWLVASLFAVGCVGENTTDQPKRDLELPGTIVDSKSDTLTDYYTDFRGELSLDDTRFDTYQPTWEYYYNGYEIQLQAGDIIALRAGAASYGFDTVIGLYGPKNGSDWGALLDANDDANGSLDSELSFEATEGGTYLLMLQDYDWRAGEAWVSAECIDGPCAAAQCAQVVCALWCEHGFVRDANGCDTCSCASGPGDLGSACSMYGDQCSDGLECAYECPDGSSDANCNLGINPSGTCVEPFVAVCADGDTKPAADGCNSCTCTGGDWACTEMACPAPECVTDSDCVRTGCSGQICAAEQMVTTCDWHPDYACYEPANTACGCNNGMCGWAQTAALSACLGS